MCRCLGALSWDIRTGLMVNFRTVAVSTVLEIPHTQSSLSSASSQFALCIAYSNWHGREMDRLVLYVQLSTALGGAAVASQSEQGFF